ncbi:MAG: HEPN domain-containing protein [Candidatus Helarchaeota archaeon]|nr:HEPN domain-containing protein [Candidatus Helarchaeota archaeon]
MWILSQEQRDLTNDFLSRANRKLEEAKNHLEKHAFPESISTSQECLELSIKALFLSFSKAYPSKHPHEKEFENAFIDLIRNIPSDLKYENFPRMLFLCQLWSHLCTKAKYGYKKAKVGPTKLFEQLEAQLALNHANECLTVARRVYIRICESKTIFFKK